VNFGNNSVLFTSIMPRLGNNQFVLLPSSNIIEALFVYVWILMTLLKHGTSAGYGLICRGLRCSWICLSYKGLSCIWTSLHYRSMCCTWTCLHYRGLCCTRTCLHYRGLCCTWMFLTQQGPGLHLDVSTLKRPLLLLDVSTPQRPEMHLDLSTVQSPFYSWKCIHFWGLCCSGLVNTTEPVLHVHVVVSTLHGHSCIRTCLHYRGLHVAAFGRE
jgi:hypothetical protein